MDYYVPDSTASMRHFVSMVLSCSSILENDSALVALLNGLTFKGTEAMNTMKRLFVLEGLIFYLTSPNCTAKESVASAIDSLITALLVSKKAESLPGLESFPDHDCKERSSEWSLCMVGQTLEEKELSRIGRHGCLLHLEECLCQLSDDLRAHVDTSVLLGYAPAMLGSGLAQCLDSQEDRLISSALRILETLAGSAVGLDDGSVQNVDSCDSDEILESIDVDRVVMVRKVAEKLDQNYTKILLKAIENLSSPSGGSQGSKKVRSPKKNDVDNVMTKTYSRQGIGRRSCLGLFAGFAIVNN